MLERRIAALVRFLLINFWKLDSLVKMYLWLALLIWLCSFILIVLEKNSRVF